MYTAEYDVSTLFVFLYDQAKRHERYLLCLDEYYVMDKYDTYIMYIVVCLLLKSFMLLFYIIRNFSVQLASRVHPI